MRVGRLVECLPGNQHGHYDCLAGSRCHLVSDAKDPGIGVIVETPEFVQEIGSALLLRGSLRKEDGSLQRFDLAEEEGSLTTRI